MGEEEEARRKLCEAVAVIGPVGTLMAIYRYLNTRAGVAAEKGDRIGARALRVQAIVCMDAAAQIGDGKRKRRA